MWPAWLSSGSTSPRKRSGARASITSEARGAARRPAAFTVGIAAGRTGYAAVATAGGGAPVSIGPPAAFQAAHPPSSTATSRWPIQRSSHQACAA
jgi:hypothetical protein